MVTDSHQTLELVRMLRCAIQASYSGSGHSSLAAPLLADGLVLWEVLSAERSNLHRGHTHFISRSNSYPVTYRCGTKTQLLCFDSGHPGCRAPMGPAEASVSTTSLGTQPKTYLEVIFTFPKPLPESHHRPIQQAGQKSAHFIIEETETQMERKLH